MRILTPGSYLADKYKFILFLKLIDRFLILNVYTTKVIKATQLTCLTLHKCEMTFAVSLKIIIWGDVTLVHSFI